MAWSALQVDRDGNGEMNQMELLGYIADLFVTHAAVSQREARLVKLLQGLCGDVSRPRFTACMRLVRDVELRAVNKLIQAGVSGIFARLLRSIMLAVQTLQYRDRANRIRRHGERGVSIRR